MRSPLLTLILLAACSSSEPPGGEPISAFVSIQAGDDYTCGLAADGIAWCWGSSTSGFGDSLSGTRPEYTPRPAGAASWWGANGGGALGNGSSAFAPVAVSGGLEFASLEATGGLVCGISTAADLYCWGRGDRTPAQATSAASPPPA
jgi:hypothetical protein